MCWRSIFVSVLTQVSLSDINVLIFLTLTVEIVSNTILIMLDFASLGASEDCRPENQEVFG